MKNFNILGIMLLIALISGCKKDVIVKLATPAPMIDTVASNTATIVWEAVENAASYAYTVNDGEETNVTGTEAVLEGLEAETEYTVKVKAVAGDAGPYADSDWGTVTVTTQKETFAPTAYTVYPMDPIATMNEANLSNSYICRK